MKVVDADGILLRGVSELVGRAVRDAGLDPAVCALQRCLVQISTTEDTEDTEVKQPLRTQRTLRKRRAIRRGAAKRRCQAERIRKRTRWRGDWLVF
jgi:hypothetical protein